MPMSLLSNKRRADRRRKSDPVDSGTRIQTGLSSDESIGYLTRYAYRAFVKVLAVELAQHGLLTGQWSVFRVLWEEEGLSQVELAERMRVEKASLTSMLDGMERLELITRTRNKKDRRKVNIHLTAKGRKLKTDLLPYSAKINQRATKGMSPADVVKLKTLLEKVIVNLDV